MWGQSMGNATRRLSSGALFAAACLLTSTSAIAEGALAVGWTGDVAKDGLAVGTAINYATREAAIATAIEYCRKYDQAPRAKVHCKLVATFRRECYAVAYDPKAGTPGAGWAVAADKATAEERAIAICEASAGTDRQGTCRTEEAKCDSND